MSLSAAFAARFPWPPTCEAACLPVSRSASQTQTSAVEYPSAIDRPSSLLLSFVILHCSFKSVAHTSHRHDTFRISRILFDLLAQPANVHIHRARIAGIVVTPDLLEQSFTTERRARIANE